MINIFSRLEGISLHWKVGVIDSADSWDGPRCWACRALTTWVLSEGNLSDLWFSPKEECKKLAVTRVNKLEGSKRNFNAIFYGDGNKRRDEGGGRRVLKPLPSIKRVILPSVMFHYYWISSEWKPNRYQSRRVLFDIIDCSARRGEGLQYYLGVFL